MDAGWSKWTHKHTYNALSAVGVIFGQETSKLLYTWVSEISVVQCAKKTPQKNTCFKNWTGTSSPMESDIILEGFLAAEKQHGVHYINSVGVGDSSVYPTLVSNVPGWGSGLKPRSDHPCQLGHILSGSSGSDPVYKISRSDPDSVLDQVH